MESSILVILRAIFNDFSNAAIEVRDILSQEGELNKKGKGKHKFFVSDNPEWFNGLAKRFLGKPISGVRKVNNV